MENLDARVWEFLQDDRFIKWVHAPDEDSIAWWERWMAANPEKIDLLFKAREIARDLAYTETPADAGALAEDIWTGVRGTLDGSGWDQGRTPVKMLPAAQTRRTWYWAAASIAALAGIGAWMLYSRPAAPAVQVPQQVASRMVQQDLERTNGTKSNQQVYLVDGSRITLQPGSGIRHAIFLQKDKREVYLDGNAFFEIAKDADRPFYVYTKDLVVRVLGTSFKVVTDTTNGDVSILVQTGKVSVTRKNAMGQTPLIVSPRRQVVYKAQSRDLVESAAKDTGTADVIAAIPALPFEFEETAVVEIFRKMENAYGIRFHYDEKVFSSCVVTTSLGNETFAEKLKIVCTAIGATWKTGPDGVTIEGKPCK